LAKVRCIETTRIGDSGATLLMLARHPAVREVAVVARPDPHWGETPCAFVALREGIEVPSADALMQWCKDRMAGFKRPRYVVFGELPRPRKTYLARSSPTRMIRMAFPFEGGGGS